MMQKRKQRAQIEGYRNGGFAGPYDGGPCDGSARSGSAQPVKRKRPRKGTDSSGENRKDGASCSGDVPLVRVTRRHAMPILMARCRKHLFGPQRAVRVQAYGAAIEKALTLALDIPEKLPCCKRTSMRTYTYLPPLSLPVELLASKEKQRSALTDGFKMRQRRLPAVELAFALG